MAIVHILKDGSVKENLTGYVVKVKGTYKLVQSLKRKGT